jgi:biopolymer transport protein ExbD
LKQTYGYESTISEMWRVSDLIECLIFISLALMLVYTVFVTARFFRRYFLGPRKPPADFVPSSQQNQKNLIAELSRGVGTLKAIASCAPFLGLAGTCYGILCLFFRGFIVSKYFSTPTISLEFSTALVATAAGLIVAAPAAVCYNVLRTCLDTFGSKRSSTLLEATPRLYGFAQTLPLRGRFTGVPAFALIAAPVLAILLPMFVLLLHHSRTPMGLPVRLLKMGVSESDSAPIVVSVIGSGPMTLPVVYVNSKETPWNELGDTLRRQLAVRPHWTVYVTGEDDVPWGDVANAIDVARGLHAEVVLLTAKPTIRSSHQPGTKAKHRLLMR